MVRALLLSLIALPPLASVQLQFPSLASTSTSVVQLQDGNRLLIGSSQWTGTTGLSSGTHASIQITGLGSQLEFPSSALGGSGGRHSTSRGRGPGRKPVDCGQQCHRDRV
jgi:hypothetical protein